MCGIAGQISADPNKIAANYPAYCRMQKSLARRGPDQRGMYLHGHAALIHARLAVVDLENGCQPMVLDQGGEKYILVYNGELYNTPELHAQLAALGHRFVSHSDTEVLLHAFAQWGPDCLEKLNGIFAFAVWQQPGFNSCTLRNTPHPGVRPGPSSSTSASPWASTCGGISGWQSSVFSSEAKIRLFPRRA